MSAQTIQFENKQFEVSNVKSSIVDLKSEKILKIERDLTKIPFDVNRLENTVD